MLVSDGKRERERERFARIDLSMFLLKANIDIACIREFSNDVSMLQLFISVLKS